MFRWTALGFHVLFIRVDDVTLPLLFVPAFTSSVTRMDYRVLVTG